MTSGTDIRPDGGLDTTLTCIVCPVGCTIHVSGTPGALSISGNGCPRGRAYAEQEVTCPMRTVTSTVVLEGSEETRRLPVKTASAVPKARIADCLAEIRKARATVPVAIGDVLVADLAGTGVALVAAASAAAPRAGERIHTRVLLGRGDFLVTSPYGERIHPLTGERRFHAGVDGALWADGRLIETGICAWGAGTVVEAHAADDGPAGVFVAIDHGDGLVTKYFHMEPDTLRVAAGQSVAAGQLLGWMGKTGRSTGEHLHFQVEKDGVPVDPMPYLRR